MQPEEVRNPPPVPVTPPEPDETEKANGDLTSGFSPRTQGRLARTVAEAFSSAEAAHRRNEDEWLSYVNWAAEESAMEAACEKWSDETWEAQFYANWAAEETKRFDEEQSASMNLAKT